MRASIAMSKKSPWPNLIPSTTVDIRTTACVRCRYHWMRFILVAAILGPFLNVLVAWTLAMAIRSVDSARFSLLQVAASETGIFESGLGPAATPPVALWQVHIWRRVGVQQGYAVFQQERDERQVIWFDSLDLQPLLPPILRTLPRSVPEGTSAAWRRYGLPFPCMYQHVDWQIEDVASQPAVVGLRGAGLPMHVEWSPFLVNSILYMVMICLIGRLLVPLPSKSS